MDNSLKITQRKSIYDSLKKYDILSNKDSDFIEITEWNNEEGIDITIGRNNYTKAFSLTYGELDAINHLIEYI